MDTAYLKIATRHLRQNKVNSQNSAVCSLFAHSDKKTPNYFVVKLISRIKLVND